MRRAIVGVVLCAFVGYAACAPSGRGGAPAGTFAGCPGGVRPLPGQLASYRPTVERVALRFVRTGFLRYAQTPPASLVGARVRRVLPVRNWLPSGWVEAECGHRVWERSVSY